jgi:hypothetical protein
MDIRAASLTSDIGGGVGGFGYGIGDGVMF